MSFEKYRLSPINLSFLSRLYKGEQYSGIWSRELLTHTAFVSIMRQVTFVQIMLIVNCVEFI